MCPPRWQASFLLPGSPSAGSCTSRPHPVPMAKERRTHLLLVFMVMPLHWVFHSIRRTRLLFKSCDLPTSLITWGVKRQSSARSVSSGALLSLCGPTLADWAAATGLEGEWANGRR